MAASYITYIMGIAGFLLCIYDGYTFVHVKRAIDLQNSWEIPFVASLLGIGYQIGWILYFNTVVPDIILLVLNIARLVIALLILMSFVFTHFGG